MIRNDTTFVIVGLGLLGGSYAMGLKEAGYRVLGVARRQETIDHALAHHMIDAGTLDPEEFLDQADIVVFALYPHIMIDWIHEHQNAFRPGTLLTDVSGVKVNVADKVQSFLRDDVEFIAAHPMAGREVGGYQSSTDTLFDGASFIITPIPENKPENIALVQSRPGVPLYAYGEEEQRQLMAEQAEKLTAPLAVAYCNRCTAGLLLGGAKAVHLMELCMGTWQGEKMGKPGDFA